MSNSDSNTYIIHESNTPFGDTDNTSSQLNSIKLSTLNNAQRDICMKMNNPTTPLWNENAYNYRYYNNKSKCKPPPSKLNKSRLVSCGVFSCFGMKTSRNDLKITVSRKDSKISNTYKSISSLQTLSSSSSSQSLAEKVSLPINKANKAPSSIHKIKTTTLPLSSNEKITSSSPPMNNFKEIGDFNTSHIKPSNYLFPRDLNRPSTCTTETFENESIQTNSMIRLFNNHDDNNITGTYSSITSVPVSQQIHYCKDRKQSTEQPMTSDAVKEKLYSNQLLMHFSQIVEQNYNMDINNKYIKSLNYLQIQNNVDDDGDNNRVNSVDELQNQVLINLNDNITHHQTCQAYVDFKKHESPTGKREATCRPLEPSHVHKVIQTVYSYENLYHISPKLVCSNTREHSCPRVSQSVKSRPMGNAEENLKNDDINKARKMDGEKAVRSVREITTNPSKQSDDNFILNKSLGSCTKTSSESLKQEGNVRNTLRKQTAAKPNTTSKNAVKQNCRTMKQPEIKSKSFEKKSTVNNNLFNLPRDMKTAPFSSHLQNSHCTTRKLNPHTLPPPTRTRRADHSLPNKGSSYVKSVNSLPNQRRECKTPEPIYTIHKNVKSETYSNSHTGQNLRRGMPSASFREDQCHRNKLKQDIFRNNQGKLTQKPSNKNQKYQLNNRRSFMSTKENIKGTRKSTDRSFDRFQTHSISSGSCTSVNTLDLIQLADISDADDIREIKDYVFDESFSENDRGSSTKTSHFTGIPQVNNEDHSEFMGFPVDRQTQNRYVYPPDNYIYQELNSPPYVQPKYLPFLPFPIQPVVPLRNIGPLWNNIPNYESPYPGLMRPPLLNTPPFVNWANRNSYINPYNNKYYNDPYYQYLTEQYSTSGGFPLHLYQSYNNTYHNSETTSKHQVHTGKTLGKNKVCGGGKKKKT